MKIPLRQYLRVLAASLPLAGVLLVPAASHAAVPSGSLIKGKTGSAVYYVEAGRRYAFPNDRVFHSWFSDFSSVVTVNDTDLAEYALTGNVRFRPGAQLVKITTDPKVYAISQYGTLRWIMNEQAAIDLYGAAWNKNVWDVPDEFFMNYVRGSDVGRAEDFNKNEAIAITRISDDIRPERYVPPVVPTTPPAAETPAPLLSVVLSTSYAALNQMVLVVATISNAATPIAKIEIFNDQQSAPIATCNLSVTCSFMYTVKQAPLSARFFAVATDELGIRTNTPSAQQGALTVSSVSTDIQMNVVPLQNTAGQRVSFTSDAQRIENITSHKVYAVIPGEPNPVLWKDCKNESFCSASTPFHRTTQLYSHVITGGQTHQSASVTVEVTSGLPPKPTLTLLSKPRAGQAILRLEAPSGETMGWSTIVVGTTPENDAIALCEFSSCEVTVQFTTPQTYTAFTDVAGKLEGSNSIHLEP